MQSRRKLLGSFCDNGLKHLFDRLLATKQDVEIALALQHRAGRIEIIDGSLGPFLGDTGHKSVPSTRSLNDQVLSLTPALPPDPRSPHLSHMQNLQCLR
jgi:hypothetical protein